MRVEPKSAGVFSAGSFLFLLIFGLGWPGPGAWLLVFALLFIAAAAAAWWLDGAVAAPAHATGAMAGAGASPFGRTAGRAGGRAAGRTVGGGPAARGARRVGDSLLLNLGLPGPDRHGRWVLPDRVHVALVAGLVGGLALIIFIGGALGGGRAATPGATTASTPVNPVLDFSRSITPGEAATGSTSLPLPGATSVATSAGPLTPAGATPTTDPAPIRVDTPTTTRPEPARPLVASGAPRAPARTVSYEVEAGDTIYDLAIQYETSIEAIMNANGIGAYDTIRVGQALIIPVGAAD